MTETSLWQEHTSTCDKCEQGLQDEKHAVFLCSCASVCSLRRAYAQLFSDFPSSYRIFLDDSGTFYYSQASSEDAIRLIALFLISFFVQLEQQTEQPNYLAEGQTPL